MSREYCVSRAGTEKHDTTRHETNCYVVIGSLYGAVVADAAPGTRCWWPRWGRPRGGVKAVMSPTRGTTLCKPLQKLRLVALRDYSAGVSTDLSEFA